MGLPEKINTKNILSTSKIGLWCVEFEEGKPGRFYADKVMDELLGVESPMTPEERYIFHQKHIHPDDMPLFQEYAAKLAEVRTEIVYRYIHPISGVMIVRCGGTRDTSVKEYICTTGTHQDISDTMRLEKEKEAEHRLAEINKSLLNEKVRQEDYYKDLLDMQNCGVMAYTLPEYRIMHMNAQALRMYGLQNIEEAQCNLGHVLSSVFYPAQDTLEKLKSLREVDDMVDYECILNKGTDKECHVVAKTKVARVPSGERAVVTTFLDVSDMVFLKEALRKAEEGSRAKSAFLFAMSHDLRTPMNAIIGYTELMEKHWEDRELTSRYLHKMEGASRFLMELIGNVLELARIESGKEVLNEAPGNLLQITDTLDSILSNEVSGKNLSIIKDIQIQHEDVICDGLKVREILMNLLTNAIKYTPAGGKVSLTVEELPSDRDGYIQTKTIVADTGIGISQEYFPHLFERFSRERNSSESGIMGTGLGLPIVKSFVDLMEGSISVESEPGKGTSFTVILPFKINTDKKNTEQQTAYPGNWSLEEKRILLTEDNELNAEIAMTILKDAGSEVELAPDGEMAISMLNEAPVDYYDLILMDIQMPHMNGYEATRRIRALPDKRSRIPVIAMTANAFEEDRQASLAAGMDGYVAKPVNVKNLIHTIKSVVG